MFLSFIFLLSSFILIGDKELLLTFVDQQFFNLVIDQFGLNGLHD